MREAALGRLSWRRKATPQSCENRSSKGATKSCFDNSSRNRRRASNSSNGNGGTQNPATTKTKAPEQFGAFS